MRMYEYDCLRTAPRGVPCVEIHEPLRNSDKIGLYRWIVYRRHNEGIEYDIWQWKKTVGEWRRSKLEWRTRIDDPRPRPD